MKSIVRRSAVLGISLATLSGCASLGETPMVDMAVSHNQTIDQIERNTLLLNILRAADEQPLTFTAISYVGGNGSISSALSLSDSRKSFLAHVLSFSASAELGVSSGFSYSLSTLDNEQFNRSFLADLPLERLRYLHVGTSLYNSVLWTLAGRGIEANELADGEALSTRRYNNSTNPQEWAAFQELIAGALRLGMSFEDTPIEVPLGPRMSSTEAKQLTGTIINNWNQYHGGGAVAGTARPKLVELGGPDAALTHQLVMVSNKIRLCFNPPKIQEWPYDGEALCRSGSAHQNWLRLQASRPPTAPPLPPISLKLQNLDIRSPREIFYFLGSVVRPQLERPGSAPALVSAQKANEPARPLINIVCGRSPADKETLAVATHRGRACHIPRGDNSHSAHVMQYLGLLVTLSKVAGAVPTSPAVLLR